MEIDGGSTSNMYGTYMCIIRKMYWKTCVKRMRKHIQHIWGAYGNMVNHMENTRANIYIYT